MGTWFFTATRNHHLMSYLMRLCLFCALILLWNPKAAFSQATATKPIPLQVDWHTEEGLRVSGSRPVYPQIAELAQIQGVVRISMVAGTDGVPHDVQFVSGAPLLMGAAMNAVKTWRFRPMLVNGAPVEVETVASVNFFLPGQDPASVLARDRERVQKRPRDPKAHEALARELLQDGQLSSSAEEFRQAIALKPRDAALHFGLADALRQSSNLPAAIAEYHRGLDLAPKVTQAQEDLAACLEQAGDSDSALSEYEKVLQRDRQDGSVHFRVALLLMNKNDVEGAIKEFRSALHYGFDTPAAHYRLGTALEKKDQLKDALREYKRASSEAPQEKSYQQATDRVEQALQHNSAGF